MSRDRTAEFGRAAIYTTSGPRGSGEARSAGLTLSHPLIRSYRRNLTLSLALDGLNSENAAFGSLISTERSRAVRAAAGN